MRGQGWRKRDLEQRDRERDREREREREGGRFKNLVWGERGTLGEGLGERGLGEKNSGREALSGPRVPKESLTACRRCSALGKRRVAPCNRLFWGSRPRGFKHLVHSP